MGDTKRGREQQGQKKREQLIRHEIDETLDADEEPPDPATEEPDIEETELENISLQRAEDADDDLP
ncbi:MAG: hypothetical protein ABEJ60_04085 [Halodesulfurarchaeum sp.]